MQTLSTACSLKIAPAASLAGQRRSVVRGTSSLSSHGSTTGRGCGTRAIKSRRDPSSSSTRLSTTTTRAVHNGEHESSSSSSSSSSRASNREDDDNRATSVATATATIARAPPRAGASPPGTADAVDKLPTRAAAAAAAKRRFDVTAASASLEKLARRYDWLSASLGALLGTSYGVYRGQPPAEALGLTLCATVVAVAIDEVIKDFEAKQK